MRREPITAPPAEPPRYSLLSAVQANGQTSGSDRWEAGVTWNPEACGGGALLAAECAPSPDDPRAVAAQPGIGWASPFYVYADDSCSSFAHAGRDWQGRARRRLEAVQSFQIAQELWRGDFTQDTQPDDEDANQIPLRNPFLRDTTQVIDASDNAQRAIAVAEAAAMRTCEGRRIAVHVPIVVLEAAMADGSYLQRDTGGVITTAMGSIVIADAGYDGSGPIGAPEATWIYATTIPRVRLGAVEVLPATLDDAAQWAQALNRATNSVTIWAQRLALYQLDPCCRIAVSTDVDPVPTPTTLDPS